MLKVNIIETNLKFRSLSERQATEILVIHHTGSTYDYDFSAAKIHEIHLNQDWAGIGYHFVVRKDGTVERGRPEWAVGSHALHHNYNTIGIHLSGDFNAAKPTDKQIESCAMLCAYLCEKYGIPTDRNHIIGHDECYAGVGETDGAGCPGRNLQSKLDLISEKANFYRYGAEKPVQVEVKEVEVVASQKIDIEKVAVLARKYESNGDPACVSSGVGDLGGISYGLYQFSSKVGVVDKFVEWLCQYPDDALANYGRVLAKYKVNSDDFINQWDELGTVDPGNFGKLQDEYVQSIFYDQSAVKFAKEGFNIDKHTNALKAVVFARAVQNGVTGCVKLFKQACTYPNLTYVDDAYFDGDLIGAVYDFLISECDSALPDEKGVWRSNLDFCHGSKSVINALRNRFISERADALAMLTGGVV